MHKILTLLVILSFSIAGCTAENESFVKYNGTEYRVPEPVPDFNLTDQNGNNVSLSDYKGKVLGVAFIFTSCPDFIDQPIKGFFGPFIVLAKSQA